MACVEKTNPVLTNDYIRNAILKIDQIQKETALESACESCDSPLFARLYNTKPVSFYLRSGGLFTVNIPNAEVTTTLFRIEEVRQDAVILRLLQNGTAEITCTNYTVVLRIDCVCGLQCFDPICCPECTRCPQV